MEGEKRDNGSTTFKGRAKKLEQKFKAANLKLNGLRRKKVEEEKKEAPPPVKIKIDIGMFGDDDEQDLLNEGDLLTGDSLPDMTALSVGADVDDCGGRKACDNCSCGRKEQEEAASRGEISEIAAKQAPSSACGNCSKGDAFRCASCPYLGKPAFREGQEHLVLDLADDF